MTVGNTTRSEFVCGGTIIHSLYILTAAHCVFNTNDGPIPPENIFFMIGDVSNNLTTTTSKYRGIIRPALLFVYPKYGEFWIENDIALFRLTDRVPFRKGFIAVTPISADKIPINTTCETAGWGWLAENLKFSVVDQRKVHVPILPDSACRSSYGPYFQTRSKFCAGYLGGGKGTCFSDSGGGLYCNNTVHGIISMAIGCARPHFPTMYVNVTAYRKWIFRCYKFNGTQKDIPMPYWKKKKPKPTPTVPSRASWLFVNILQLNYFIFIVFINK